VLVGVAFGRPVVCVHGHEFVKAALHGYRTDIGNTGAGAWGSFCRDGGACESEEEVSPCHGSVSSSELHLQSKLELSGDEGRSRFAEVNAAQIQGRVVEVNVVERIECLPAELHGNPFRHSDLLRKRSIDLSETRAAECVPPKVAARPQRRQGEYRRRKDTLQKFRAAESARLRSRCWSVGTIAARSIGVEVASRIGGRGGNAERIAALENRKATEL